MSSITVKAVVSSGDPQAACGLLAMRSGLSKSRIKDAMNKGAVWLKRRRGKNRRLRRNSTKLVPGDQIALYYDEEILKRISPQSECLQDQKLYSVWSKPGGLMAQGTLFGDHCSLMRQAQQFFKPSREVFLVHRLDREAEGLMLLAHAKSAAAKISQLFRERKICKRYRATVLGDLWTEGKEGKIELPLDGKQAITEYRVAGYDQSLNASIVDVRIRTGRYHQIRRHFHMIGFPLIGDPRYGKRNKNADGLQLCAYYLSFRCPFTGEDMEFSLPV